MDAVTSWRKRLVIWESDKIVQWSLGEKGFEGAAQGPQSGSRKPSRNDGRCKYHGVCARRRWLLLTILSLSLGFSKVENFALNLLTITTFSPVGKAL